MAFTRKWMDVQRLNMFLPTNKKAIFLTWFMTHWFYQILYLKFKFNLIN